ncbi:hypothetical protein IAT40_000412 [Kwoniella sp. CBS 6097]
MSRYQPVGSAPAAVVPFKRPSAYDQFEASSWMDQLQAKISKGLNPPDSPGPSRSPSPIIQDSAEVLTQQQRFENDNGNLLYGQEEDEEEDEDEQGSYSEDNDDLHADQHQAEIDEESDGIEILDDSEEDYDDNEEHPQQAEHLFNDDQVEGEEQLFESQSQGEYDPAYGVVAEEDNAAYVGSDGDVYVEEDDEVFDDIFDEDEEEEEQEVVEDDGDDQEEAVGDSDEEEDEEDAEEEDDDEEIEYIGTSQSPGHNVSNLPSSPAPPNNLYPVLPPPPQPIVNQDTLTNANAEDQLAQFPTFSDEAIDPNLLAEIVQQVHEAMPEDEAGPSSFIPSIPTDNIFQTDQVHQPLFFDPSSRATSEEVADYDESRSLHDDGSAAYDGSEAGYGGQESLFPNSHGFGSNKDVKDNREHEDEDEVDEDGEEDVEDHSEADYEEDELDQESEHSDAGMCSVHLVVSARADVENTIKGGRSLEPVRQPITSDGVIEIGSSSDEDDENEDDDEEEEDEEEDDEVVEEDNVEVEGSQRNETRDYDVQVSDDGSEGRLPDTGSNDTDEEDGDDIVMEDSEEGIRQIDVEEDILVEKTSNPSFEEIGLDQAGSAEGRQAEEAIMYDGEVIEDRHTPKPEIVFPPDAARELGMDVDEPVAVEVEIVELSQTVEVIDQADPLRRTAVAEADEAARSVDTNRIATEAIEVIEASVEQDELANEDIRLITTTEKPLSVDHTTGEGFVESEVKDLFTVSVEDNAVAQSEEATPSPLQRPADRQSEEAFNGEDYISFDSPEPAEEAYAAQSPVRDPIEKDSDGGDEPTLPDVLSTVQSVETTDTYMGDPVDNLPDPRASPPDATSAMPYVPHVQQPLSEISPSLIVEPPANPTSAELVSPVDAARPDTPTAFPDPSARAPDTHSFISLDPHAVVSRENRSPSLVVEPAEHDPDPEDVITEEIPRAETPVSLPDPTLAPPNTYAVQPLDIHNLIPKENVTPSLIVEIAQDPVPVDIISAGPSRQPTPPTLPDPRLSPPDTTVDNPLNSLDLEPRLKRSPSLMVEAPEADTAPEEAMSVAVSRAATPVVMPDPELPPPDSYLQAPITPHDLSPSSEPQTPSLDVEPPADTPTAAVFSRLPSGTGSVVDAADLETAEESDDDIQIDVRQVSPTRPDSNSPDASETDEQEEENSVQAEEVQVEEQHTNEPTTASSLTSDPFSALHEPVDDDEIVVEVQHMESKEISSVEPSLEIASGTSESDEEESNTLGAEAIKLPPSEVDTTDRGIAEAPSSDATMAEESPQSERNSSLVSQDPPGNASDMPEPERELELRDPDGPDAADAGVEADRSDEDRTEAGSPVKKPSDIQPPPLPHMTSSAIMRLRHVHGNALDQPPAIEAAPSHRRTRSKARTSTSASPAPEPRVTRSHCFYEKLRVTDDDLTAVIMVPHCAVSDAERLVEEMAEVEGPASDMEELEARIQQMDQSHPILHPRLTTKIHRIVGAQIFDEGHCYLLYATDDAKLPPSDEFGTPKSTASGKHRSRKSLSAVPPRLNEANDDEIDEIDRTTKNASTPTKRPRTASPARRRSLPKRQAGSASVEPEVEITVTPARRGGSVKPASARKGKGRESSIVSDAGSIMSTTGSPGPTLRRSARVSAARGEDIPEETLPVPDTVKEEEESDGRSVNPPPTPEVGDNNSQPTPLRRSGRRSVAPKLYTPSPEPVAQADVKPEVGTPTEDDSASPLKSPASAIRGRARKSLTLASKQDEAPYRPASDDEEDEGDDDDDSTLEPPTSAHSTLSVEIPMRKRKSRASDIAQEEVDQDQAASSTPASSNKRKRKSSRAGSADTHDDEAEKDNAEADGAQEEVRGSKRRAVESRLVPGTPVPEPQSSTDDEPEEDRDVEVTMESTSNPTQQSAQSGLTRSQSWGGRFLSRFGWGRR